MVDSEKIFIILTLDEEEFFNLKELPAADFLEIRLDLFQNSQGKAKAISEAIDGLKAHTILTYRQPEDSSLKAKSLWTQEDVAPLLKDLNNGKHYLDLELDKDNSIFANVDEADFGIVQSIHSFAGILGLEELEFYFRTVAEESLGAKQMDLPFDRILKIAVMPNNESDVEEFRKSSLKISRLVQKQSPRLGYCSILMGERGRKDRIFPEGLGSRFTYTCLGEPKAPGQINLKTLLHERNGKF
ncbi:putative 3-dehydroquinate dehydratase, type I [Leptospira fainei serovar Hurstbridge str. BUT 6]|uniref:3-dehydroquinate dehydratase n=1 Tax=Leptospira fainei serovar Hurstbridge str. BUT 6 TaxID=1193011 RepID=S3VY52_9LEPT|nr:type I 3-dehydroquinate dehydratase [Leptospira fainei]EPG73037.1 putative 3-dehydroquinate dehydratase, type I [Leptospira fainei serovar Hurstbridge str. BUT 6]